MAKPEGGPLSQEVTTSSSIDSYMRERNKNVFRRARNWGIGIFVAGVAVASAALTLPISLTAATAMYIAGGITETAGVATWVTGGVLKHANRTVKKT